jgi:hypothetical protein
MYYEFRVGSVLGRGFSVFFKNLIPFLFLGAVLYSPVIFFTHAVAMAPTTTNNLLTFVVHQSLALLATAMMMYGTFQQLRGHHASLGASVAGGLARLFPVLGVGFLVLLCLVGASVPIFVLAYVGLSAGMGTGTFVLVLLYLPVLIAVYCMLWVAIPVAVVEKPGILASLRRSAELTKGYRLAIFGLLFVLVLLLLVVAIVLGILLGGRLLDGNTAIVFEHALNVVSMVVMAVITAVGYHDLRLAKDGIDVQELEAVFD